MGSSADVRRALFGLSVSQAQII